MKLQKTLVSLFVCILLLVPAAVASAGPPPQSDDPSPENGGFDPVPIQPGRLVRDPATGSVIYAELTETPASLRRAEATAATEKGAASISSLESAEFHVRSLEGDPDTTIPARDLLIGSSGRGERTEQDVGIASSTFITTQGFEGAFPTGSWNQVGTHQWDAVNCLPVDGSWSAWPANNVANPCAAANYPDNVIAWLDYGPFSLADAQSAYLDFFYRSDIQNTQICDDPVADNCDYFFWGASTNLSSFTGVFETGSHTDGPFLNGYNFASLDLSYLAGEPQVWITFGFVSNGDGITGQGPFIDLISLRKNTDPRRYLTDENFDVDIFPNESWISLDMNEATGGDYWWDDWFCYSRSGDWSMWPAGGGADGRIPCFPGQDYYANNMDSWLIHGPFSLVGANEAWVDFHIRVDIEYGYDDLIWAASVDDLTYYIVDSISGTFVNGPHNNGYNLLRVDLSNVPAPPAVGTDWRGKPEVWIAFIFQSDATVTYQGPFIDDVSVVVEGQAEENQHVYLPIVQKSLTTQTRVHITNQTGGTLTYKVKDTPEGTKSCSVPNNQQKLCATFTSGTYDWEAQAHCGTASGNRYYPPGDDYPKPFECQ